MPTCRISKLICGDVLGCLCEGLSGIVSSSGSEAEIVIQVAGLAATNAELEGEVARVVELGGTHKLEGAVL